MITNKFLTMKWEWLEEALDDEEIETLYGLLEKASTNKPDYKYLVVNTDEPYAQKVLDIIKSKKAGMTKEDLIKTLNELTEADPELAHSEADELLIRYINDKDIEEAFEEVPKWYA